jgi:hypothetical protein
MLMGWIWVGRIATGLSLLRKAVLFIGCRGGVNPGFCGKALVMPAEIDKLASSAGMKSKKPGPDP